LTWLLKIMPPLPETFLELILESSRSGRPPGEALAISVPRGETAVLEHFQAQMCAGNLAIEVTRVASQTRGAARSQSAPSN
jgi:hypothetical protein